MLRHRIALLALLAAVHPRARTRDTLIGLVWPEHDTEGARKLLNQSVYVLRKALGEHALVSDRDELRLDTAFIEIDVIEFENALARRDYARAVQLYTGPLLDGFFLSHALEFEQWLESERGRLAAGYAKALEACAAEADAAGDPVKAAEWWQLRAAHDPYDSRVALRVMEALEACGNRARALQHARVHAQLLRDEFGTEVPGEIRVFAERLRTTQPQPHDQQSSVAAVSSPDPEPTAVATASPALPPSSAGNNETPSRFSSRFLRPIAGLIVVALSAVVLARAWPDGAVEVEATPAIAVLPLEHFGVDPADRPIAVGMTEALITRLTQLGGVRVAGSTTVQALLSRGVDARALADSLRLDFVVEGGVRKVGDQLRVRIGILDAGDGATRWSRTYEGAMHDVFVLQDEIASSVARELGVHVAGTQSQRRGAGTDDVAAYELYLRGSDRLLLRSDSGANAAVEYFRGALALDSNYAGAWAGLGRLYGRVSSTASRAERDRYLALGRQAVERALALDDSLAEAHATLGLFLIRDADFAAAEQHMRRALALHEQAIIHEWLVALYLWTGHPQQALVHARRALTLEPLSPTANAELARALAGNDRCPEALEQLRPLQQLQPPLLRVTPLAALCHARLEQWDTALALLRAPLAGRSDSGRLGLIGYVLARTGRTAEAARMRDTLHAAWERGDAAAFDLALAYAGSGELDASFRWLDRAVAELSPTLNASAGLIGQVALRGPLFAELQGDPRFDALLHRLNLQKR